LSAVCLVSCVAGKQNASMPISRIQSDDALRWPAPIRIAEDYRKIDLANGILREKIEIRHQLPANVSQRGKESICL